MLFAWSPSFRSIVCVGAACAVLSGAAVAQGKDDLWDITTKMEMAGMPFAMPAQNSRICVEKGNDAGLVPTKENSDCRVTDSKRTGNKLTFNVTCTGKDPMTGRGEITSGADSYEGKMQMKGTSGGQSFDMTNTFSGKRVGSCTSTIKQDVAKMQAQADQAKAQSCDIAMKQFIWQSFEPGQACAAQRNDFCTAVTRAGMQAAEPAAYLKARKETMLADAFPKCGKDFSAVTAAACGRGVETRDWAFIGSGYCDDKVRMVGEAQCNGRSFTGMERGLAQVCSRYASLSRGQAMQGMDAASSPASPQQTAQPAPQQDALGEQMKQLKKLLPF